MSSQDEPERGSENPLLELAPDRQEELIAFYEQNHEPDDSVSRRGFLGAAAAVLAGSAIGGGAYAVSTEEVAAATAAVGQVGEPGNTVDVYGDAITANSVDTERIGSNQYYAGSKSGSSADARLDNAITDSTTNQIIHLELNQYTTNRTISARRRFVGVVADASSGNGTRIDGATWTLTDFWVRVEHISIASDGELSLNERKQSVQDAAVNGIITVASDECTLTEIRGSGSLTFQSGTANSEVGIVDGTITITDNGNNSILGGV